MQDPTLYIANGGMKLYYGIESGHNIPIVTRDQSYPYMGDPGLALPVEVKDDFQVRATVHLAFFIGKLDE